ncbi:MAG: methionine-R-sulfoxide reductase [Pirellulaceae bacterium]|nr:methionine-R-sulfoxide reductase [Pirellulaceae bacterium]
MAVLCGALCVRSGLSSQSTVDSLSGQGLAVTRVAAPPVESETDKPGTPANRRKKAVDKDDKANVEYNELTAAEAYVILRRGTERAFTGEYTDLKEPGTYICRRCNASLYYSDSKFESHCGWPSFDDEIKGAVKRKPEIDGTRRIEIVCNNCGGHLGHVFLGEGYTAKNTRHCVNSISMKFIAKGQKLPEVIKGKRKGEFDAKRADAEAKKDDAKKDEGKDAVDSAKPKSEATKPAGASSKDGEK